MFCKTIFFKMLRKFHEASMASFSVVKIFVNLKIHELTKIYPIYYYKILTRVPTTFTFLVKIGSTELNIDFSKKNVLYSYKDNTSICE